MSCSRIKHTSADKAKARELESFCFPNSLWSLSSRKSTIFIAHTIALGLVKENACCDMDGGSYTSVFTW